MTKTLNSACPSWCVNTDTEDHLHYGETRFSADYEDGVPVSAIKTKTFGLIPGRALVQLNTWHDPESDGRAVETEHALTPDEARQLARYLLAGADEAEGNGAVFDLGRLRASKGGKVGA